MSVVAPNNLMTSKTTTKIINQLEEAKIVVRMEFLKLIKTRYTQEIANTTNTREVQLFFPKKQGLSLGCKYYISKSNPQTNQ